MPLGRLLNFMARETSPPTTPPIAFIICILAHTASLLRAGLNQYAYIYIFLATFFHPPKWRAAFPAHRVWFKPVRVFNYCAALSRANNGTNTRCVLLVLVRWRSPNENKGNYARLSGLRALRINELYFASSGEINNFSAIRERCTLSRRQINFDYLTAGSPGFWVASNLLDAGVARDAYLRNLLRRMQNIHLNESFARYSGLKVTFILIIKIL